jgi:hypothetical protein
MAKLPAAAPAGAADPVRRRPRDLEQIALAALSCTRARMQSGSPARVVHECGAALANRQEVELLGLRVVFTPGGIGAGIGIPPTLRRPREF